MPLFLWFLLGCLFLLVQRAAYRAEAVFMQIGGGFARNHRKNLAGSFHVVLVAMQFHHLLRAPRVNAFHAAAARFRQAARQTVKNKLYPYCCQVWRFLSEGFTN